MTDIIELELVEEKPVEVDIDFEGEYVSGTTGEEYGKGYDAGFTDGEKQGYNNGYAEGETQGYDKGFASGESQGYNNGYTKGETDGRQAEYDEFWDDYQENGERTDYTCAFGGCGWTNDTFKPKYNIIPLQSYMMFRMFNYLASKSTIDLVSHLDELGITLDFSNCSSGGYEFQNAKISRVGVINLVKQSTLNSTFLNSSIETIEGLGLKSDGTQIFNSTFTSCSKLKNVNSIQGTIGRTISLSSCPLTAQSAINFINALKDYSGTSSELAYTITFSSTTKEALNALGNTAPDGLTWLEYAFSKGWNT